MRTSAAAVALAAVLALSGGAAAEPLPTPRGTVPADDGGFRSGRSFKDTVAFYDKFLARRGLDHQRVGPYRRRGVLVARFILRGRAPWRAIHVWQQAGRTRVTVVETGPDAAATPGP